MRKDRRGVRLREGRTHFDYLIDISTLDHYGEDPRFSVVYELSGISHQQNLRLKTTVTEEHGEVPTVTSVWRTADWHEREAYDMMGVKFAGHPNLKRILMGGLSVLSVTQRFSARRQTHRDPRRGQYGRSAA